MKRILFLLLFLPLFIFADNISDISIIFTGDIQGHLKPEYATYMNPSFPPTIGNAASFIPFLKKERLKDSNLIVISNGNIFTDNAFQPIEKTEKVTKFLKDVGYDFINFGVYDISVGPDLKPIVGDFPYVSSNAIFRDFPIKQYEIIERNGVKIGIFGLVSEYLKLFNQGKYWDDVDIENELGAAKRMVSILKAHNVDIIIAVTDIGDQRDRYIAENVNGIDFILGGFNGRGIDKPIEDKKTHTVIFRTYGKMGSIALFHIYYDKERKSIVGYKGEAKTLFDYESPISDSILNAYRFKKINGKWISE
ncbi:MAG: hypothetical protein GWP03_04930 [Proteobacteria bacterium]|nr:hypothetical protein [Pseudomonadota bacterium]